MAATQQKKNYIGYELKWLEKRCRQLMDWCEEKLENGIEDRLEESVSTKGNPIIKVIASEETQIKCLRDTLKELPNMLMQINNLRKLVEEDEKSVALTVRGGHDMPGFMEDEDEDNEDRIEEQDYEGEALDEGTFDDDLVEEKPKKKSKAKKQDKKSPKTKIAATLKELPPAKGDDELDFEEINESMSESHFEEDEEGNFEDP